MSIKWRKYEGTENSIETEVSDANPMPVVQYSDLGEKMKQGVTIDDLYKVLQEIRDSYNMDVTIDKATNARRNLNAGGTIATVTTVTTCATVTNLSQIGALDATKFTADNSFQAWAGAIRNLLT